MVYSFEASLPRMKIELFNMYCIEYKPDTNISIVSIFVEVSDECHIYSPMLSEPERRFIHFIFFQLYVLIIVFLKH